MRESRDEYEWYHWHASVRIRPPTTIAAGRGRRPGALARWWFRVRRMFA